MFEEIDEVEFKDVTDALRRCTLDSEALTNDSMHSHLVIRVSPPSQHRRLTPNSSSRLITDTASVASGSVTPKSSRSVPSLTNDLAQTEMELRCRQRNGSVLDGLGGRSDCGGATETKKDR